MEPGPFLSTRLNALERFSTGQVAILPAGGWDIPQLRLNPIEDYGVFAAPRLRAEDPCFVTWHNDLGFAINAATDHPQEAQSIPRPAIDAGFIARLNGFWRFVEIKFYYMRPVAIVSACFTLTSSLWLFDIHYALYAMAGTEAIRAKTDVLSTFILRLFFTYDGQSLSQMMIYVAITMLNIGILTLLSLAAALTPRSFQKKLVTWR